MAYADIADTNQDQRFIGVAQRLMSDLGLSPDQARGVAWRLVSESNLLPINERVPVIPGSRGGYGFAQWTGPRRLQFESWAKDKGMSPADPEANYQYLVHDITSNFPDTLAAVKQAKDWREAYNAFGPFERTGGTPGKGTPVVAKSAVQQQLDDMFSGVPDTPATGASAVPNVQQQLDEMFAPDKAAAAAPAPDSWPVALVKGAAGTLHAVNRGLSFGLHDRIQNAIAPLMPGGTPAQAERNALYADYAKNNPNLNATGEAIGSLPGYAMGEGALARMIPTVPTSRLLDWGTAGVRNALMGGATSAALAQDNPLMAAGQGAAIGAVAPAAIGLATSTLSPVVNAVTSRLSGTAAKNQALNSIYRAMGRDAITPEDARTALAGLGPNGTLADAGGTNLLNLGETVANTPGAGADMAKTVLETRRAGQQSRINQAIAEATGAPAGYHETMDELMAQRSREARPLYEAAFASNAPVQSERIQQFLTDPIVKRGLNEGIEIQRLEALAEGKPFDANAYSDQQPTMRTLDAVKKGLDNILEGYRDSTTGKLVLDQRGRAIDQVRKAFLQELDKSGPIDEAGQPLYAKARAAWAGPSQAMDAMDLGRRALSNDPEVTAKMVSQMPDSQREFFLNGFARALKDQVGGVKDGADATRRIFATTNVRDKIRAAFGSDEAFNKFASAMEQEAAFAANENRILRGSPSARRLAGMADENTVDLLTPAALAMHGNVLGAGRHLAGQAVSSVLGTPAPAYSDTIGRALFTPGGDPELMAALMRNRNPLAAPLINRLGTQETNRLYGQ